jgi:aminobenzoyl-glutamate utilization protein B
MVRAKDYFENVQKKETEYRPMISADDPPPIELNTAIMETYRPELEPFYYDETKFDTYLEQLGVKYPTLRDE